MTTEYERQELLDILKNKQRTYTVEIVGVGCELCYGPLTKEQYEYWKSQPTKDLEALAKDRYWKLDVPKDMRFFHPDWWDSIKHYVYHHSIEISPRLKTKSYIRVKDENDHTVWLSSLNYQDLLSHDMQPTNVEVKFQWCLGNEIDEYAFSIHHIQDGTFFRGTFETYGLFDPTKLKFWVDELESLCLVDRVLYDSSEVVLLDFDVRTVSVVPEIYKVPWHK